MLIPIDRITERVCALLDENPRILQDKTEYADPGYPVLSLVQLFLEDAARIVAASAPLSEAGECAMLGTGLDKPGGHLFSAATVKVSDSCLRMDLPADFLRLAWIRMDDWTHRVTMPLAFGGDEYMLRRLPPARARRRYPAVAIVELCSLRQLEIYGSSAGAKVAEFGWLTVPRISGDTLELPKGFFTPLCAKLAEMITLDLQKERI